MQDFNLTDRDFGTVSFQSLISTGTVIVTHAIDPLAELEYYQYLHGLNQRVIVINSKQSPLLHMMADTHQLRLETYTDPELNLISRLKQQWALTPDAKALTRLLRFQIMYVDGEEQQSWHQPVVDQWKHFMADKEAGKRFINRYGTWGVKWLKEQDKDDTLLWTSFNQMAYSRPINCPWGFDVHFKYHMLMPNTQLENKLTK